MAAPEMLNGLAGTRRVHGYRNLRYKYVKTLHVVAKMLGKALEYLERYG